MPNQKFKEYVLTEKKCINSILRFYSQASITELREGMTWYNEANLYCKELASRFGITLQQAAGIIAVFSPQSHWIDNKRFAVTFLYKPTQRVKSMVQTIKAKKILALTSETDIYNIQSTKDKAYKTKAFFLNIVNPDIYTDVTIDRHAIACCIQQIDNVYALSNKYGKLTRTQYDFFQRCYVKAAKELGILPQQLQAIVWVTYRRIRDLKMHETTTEFKPFITESF